MAEWNGRPPPVAGEERHESGFSRADGIIVPRVGDQWRFPKANRRSAAGYLPSGFTQVAAPHSIFPDAARENWNRFARRLQGAHDRHRAGPK